MYMMERLGPRLGMLSAGFATSCREPIQTNMPPINAATKIHDKGLRPFMEFMVSGVRSGSDDLPHS